jgi:hypothetical protein
MTQRFSKNLPVNCPLPHAMDCNAQVFVVVKQNPLGASDLRTQADKGRAIRATGDDACKRHGLSVFPDRKSCEHQKNLFPNLGTFIASAELKPEHGKILNTPSQSNPMHQTWWSYDDVDRHSLFAVIGEE